MNHNTGLLLLILCLLIPACSEDDSAEIRHQDSVRSDSPSAVEEIDSDIVSEAPSAPPALNLVPRTIRLSATNHLVRQKEFTLNVAEGFEIVPAADGLKRVRFMAFSPDGRLFVTDMHDLSDNAIGKVYVLDDFDTASKRFAVRTTYLENLRNPNSVAFHTDGSGQDWLYVAMTDRLVRYRYERGSTGPAGNPETLATFPDHGRSYREGGWHLTRTVAFGANGKLYVSVGSSCNVCEEKEEVRATVLEMNPDGSDRRTVARGLRNAVGMRWIDGVVWVTEMGADHLGLDKPNDTFHRLRFGKHYGWPYAYHFEGRVFPDPIYGDLPHAVPPDAVPSAWGSFPAHSAPLGFDWFGGATDPALDDCFLVALHGSGAVAMKRGYSIVRMHDGRTAGDFINGFLKGKERVGRPCDILRHGSDAFFFTDDHAGVVYYVYGTEAIPENR